MKKFALHSSRTALFGALNDLINHLVLTGVNQETLPSSVQQALDYAKEVDEKDEGNLLEWKEEFLQFFDHDDFNQVMDVDECKHLFLQSLIGSSDITYELLQNLGSDYQVDIDEVVREGRAAKLSDINHIAKINGWSDAEKAHAVASGDHKYDNESVIWLKHGRAIRCPAFPEPCSYVRITQDNFEIAYWTSEEWKDMPEDVMGALLGAAHQSSNMPEILLDTILPYLDISNGNLSKETYDWLSNVSGESIGMTVAKYDYGVFINVPTEKEVSNNLPDDLEVVLEYARSKNCILVRFDKDADFVESIKNYNW